MRELGMSAGSMSSSPSQNLPVLSAVNVLIASPFKPCTATMLQQREMSGHGIDRRMSNHQGPGLLDNRVFPTVNCP